MARVKVTKNSSGGKMMSAAPAAVQGQGSAEGGAQTQQGPAPAAQLLQMALGFMATAALGCVVELEIADKLRNGPRGVAELAREAGVKEDALYRVMRALASAGIFEEGAARTFGLTRTAELLCNGVKGSLRDMVRWLATRIHFETYPEMMHSLKTGETVVEKVHNLSCFEYFERDQKTGEIFNDAMTEFSAAVIPAALEAYD